MHRRVLTLLLLPLTLAGCDLLRGGSDADDAVANDMDPALKDALDMPILTDPMLAQANGPSSVRPGVPPRAQRPTSTAALANPNDTAALSCGAPLQSDIGWARRLPANFAIYPGARMTDAAGAARDGCRVAMVRFLTPDTADKVVSWYSGRAIAGGYGADAQPRGQSRLLSGANGPSSYYLVVTPAADGGSEGALIVK